MAPDRSAVWNLDTHLKHAPNLSVAAGLTGTQRPSSAESVCTWRDRKVWVVRYYSDLAYLTSEQSPKLMATFGLPPEDGLW